MGKLRGLAVVRGAGSVTSDDLLEASAWDVQRSARLPFELKP